MANSKWRGMNISSFIEPVMMQYYIKKAHADYGTNVFRMNVVDAQHRVDSWSSEEYVAWITVYVIPNILAALKAAEDTGSKIIIDMMHLPGGTTTNRFGKSRHRIFTDEGFMSTYLDVLEMMAQTFKGHPALFGYDLINEPLVRRYKQLMPVQLEAGEAIRQIDKKAKLIFSTRYGAYDTIHKMGPYVKEMKALKYVWATFHWYWPHSVTHQGIAYPGCIIRQPQGNALYPTYTMNKNAMRKRLQVVREFQRKHRIRIYVGEFSCSRWSGYPMSDNRPQWLRDSIAIFEQYNWRYTYHAYAEAGMWDLEQPFLPCPDPCLSHCKEPTVWTESAEIIKTAFKRNKQTHPPALIAPNKGDKE